MGERVDFGATSTTEFSIVPSFLSTTKFCSLLKMNIVCTLQVERWLNIETNLDAARDARNDQWGWILRWMLELGHRTEEKEHTHSIYRAPRSASQRRTHLMCKLCWVAWGWGFNSCTGFSYICRYGARPHFRRMKKPRGGGGGGALTHNVTQVCAAVTTPIFSLLKSLSWFAILPNRTSIRFRLVP